MGVVPLAVLELARPFAALALLLPLLLWILARRPRPPRERSTGTLEAWRRVADRAPSHGARRRAGLPPGTAWLLAALALGALAWAGPRWSAATGARPWTLIVDRSPSMYLPAPGDAAAPATGEDDRSTTRLERCLEQAEAWLTQVDGDVELRWLDPGGGRAASVGDAPPGDWLRPPVEPRSELDVPALDRPGVVVLTDRAPPELAARGGLFASGGGATPGPVADTRRGVLHWDGAQLEERPRTPRTVAVDPRLPDRLEELVEAWTRARGLVAVEVPDARTALRVVGAADRASPEVALRASRDGWTIAGRARFDALSTDAGAPREAWLTAPEPRDGRRPVLVAAAAGRVDVAWTAIEQVAGPPATFAVSWAELLDARLLSGAGVVPLRERRDAGPARVRAPTEGPAAGAGERREVAPWLAIGAALAAAGFAGRRAGASGVSQ